MLQLIQLRRQKYGLFFKGKSLLRLRCVNDKIQTFVMYQSIEHPPRAHPKEFGILKVLLEWKRKMPVRHVI